MINLGITIVCDCGNREVVNIQEYQSIEDCVNNSSRFSMDVFGDNEFEITCENCGKTIDFDL